MSVYFRAKFEVSSIILTCFRHAVPLPPPQNEALKSPPRLGLNVSKFLILLIFNTSYLLIFEI